MKPLFTLHAGEYIVGSHIEVCYPDWKIWLPAKDTGVDLLVTNANNTKTVSLQVKYSKDWNSTLHSIVLRRNILAAGWWTHQEAKIRCSCADFWVFALPSFTERENNFIIITPKELLRRLRMIHGKNQKRIQSYLWITQSKCCWEARGLNNGDQDKIANGRFEDADRDFSAYLEGWGCIEQRLK